MALFLLLPALALLCVVLLAPLMLPGAAVALVALIVADVLRRHRANQAVPTH